MSQSASPQRKPIALSASRANDFQQCPLLFRFRAIDRLPEPPTQAQVKGTLVHAVLEKLHDLAPAERTFTAAVKMLQPGWLQLCEQDPSLDELFSVNELADFLVECRELLRGYFRMENPQGLTTAAVEQFLDLTLPNGVPVRGFIDRVDINEQGWVRLVDYKTGKKPRPQYAQNAMFQMQFYALMYWRATGVIPMQLRLMYLKVVDDLKMQPSQLQLEYFEREIGTLWRQITMLGVHGNYQPKTSKLCGWCLHQHLCPAFGGTPPEYPGWPGEALSQQEPLAAPGADDNDADSFQDQDYQTPQLP